MTLQLRVRSEAEQDLQEAANWYEQQRSGLGSEFLDEVLNAFNQISGQPTLYPVVHRNTRRALTQRFPFGVYFRWRADIIIVVAVMHGSRNPRRWKQRT